MPTMMPKKNQGDSGLAPGSLVVYENDGKPLLAAAVSYKNQKNYLLNQRGREVELPTFRLHQLPGKLPPQLTSIEDRSKHLDKLAESAQQESLKIDLGEIWNFVRPEQRDYATAELCQAYFGKDELASHLALHLALLTDRIFFKRRESFFIPRSVETVEDLKKSESSRLERLRIQDLLLATLKARSQDAHAAVPAELATTIKLLEEVAAGVSDLDNSKQKDAKEIIDLCAEKFRLDLQGSREQRAFGLLNFANLAGPNTNFAFVRHRFQFEYPERVARGAKDLKVPGSVSDFPENENGKRRDLTTLPCFTVDDTSTRDMDDALSIERSRDGYFLGIHVSDVASSIAPDSALDLDAKKRATSIYAPERTVNMLPPELSEDKLSLVLGQPRACLSCMIELDRNFKVLSSEVVPSLIKVTERYTYDQVDTLLDDPNSPLNTIYNIASTLEAERISNGALKMGKREIQIILDEQGDFKIVEIDENSPARSMIGEMMVLANTIMANFAVKHRLAMIFRGQDGPDPESASDGTQVAEGPAADYQVRSKLKKSFTSVRPTRHSSLALNAYIQATSPIRRYADIINQRQILEFIFHGRALYSDEQCNRFIEELNSPLAQAMAITKETRRFWLLRAFEKLSAQQTRFHATVLRVDLKNPLVEIHELGMPVLIKATRPLKPGDVIALNLNKVDARSDLLRLELVS